MFNRFDKLTEPHNLLVSSHYLKDSILEILLLHSFPRLSDLLLCGIKTKSDKSLTTVLLKDIMSSDYYWSVMRKLSKPHREVDPEIYYGAWEKLNDAITSKVHFRSICSQLNIDYGDDFECETSLFTITRHAERSGANLPQSHPKEIFKQIIYVNEIDGDIEDHGCHMHICNNKRTNVLKCKFDSNKSIVINPSPDTHYFVSPCTKKASPRCLLRGIEFSFRVSDK
tara:strand:+ start:110 stop:787 length:678 start_codon:yes stop_codon:yes gene_type:complete